MKIHRSIGIVALAALLGLGISATAFSASRMPSGLQQIQYPDQRDRYQDQRGQDQRGNYDDRFGGRGDFRGRIWRPGEQVPNGFLDRDRIVFDWEERGLMRPPGGHNWVRVGQQFLLIRFNDRRISRVLNFY